jgi:hypothetical protein
VKGWVGGWRDGWVRGGWVNVNGEWKDRLKG